MDPERPTAQHVIQWYQERAWRTGVIGFTQDSGGLQDLFKDWKPKGAPDPGLSHTPASALDLTAIVERLQMDDNLADKMHKERMEKVSKDTSLQAEVRHEVRRRLMEAGKSEQEMAESTANMTSLTMMTAYLYNVEHPPPSSGLRYKAFVYTNFRGTKKPTPIHLSAKDDLPELMASLKEFVVAKAESTGKPITDGEDLKFVDAWRYKMAVPRNGSLKLPNTAWIPLIDECDYHIMVRQASSHGGEGSVLVLMPVHPVPPKMLPKRDTPGWSKSDSSFGSGASSIHFMSSPKTPSSATTTAFSEDIGSANGIPEGMEELLEGTEPVDWADLTFRYMRGENICGDG